MLFMKRISKIICILFLCIQFFTVSAFAAPSDSQSYEMPEISASFEIPAYLNVIPKGIKQNDPLFRTGEFDYIQTMSIIRDNNDYYLIYDKEKTFTIEIRLIDTALGFDNMSKVSDKKLQSVINNISKSGNIMSAAAYDSGAYKFIEISESSNEGSNTIFTESFITTYNKQDLSVMISSINDKPTENELNIIKGIIDSIKFPEEQQIDLSALSPTLIAAFCILTLGFIAVAIVRLKNIPIPFLELDTGKKGTAPQLPEEEIQNTVSELLNSDDHKIESTEKQADPEPVRQGDVQQEKEETPIEEQPVSLSAEELAAAIANFSDSSF